MSSKKLMVPKTITRARVAEAAELMRKLEYVPGKTLRELAARWGISEAAASRYTQEASRRVASEVSDPDHLTATIGVKLDEVIRTGENRDAVAASALAAKLAGLGAPEATGGTPHQPVTLTAEWAALRSVLLEALAPYPEAHTAVVAALEAHRAGQ